MTSAFSGTTPYYNLSRTAHTSAKMSFGSRSAGICKCKNKHKILQFCNINGYNNSMLGVAIHSKMRYLQYSILPCMLQRQVLSVYGKYLNAT